MLISYGSENDITNFELLDKALHINSCGMNTTLGGTRKLSDALSVYRPLGRKDYQLLYITMGKSEHEINGEWVKLKAGQAVLYQPGENQRYLYPANTPVCCKWVHFTGTMAHDLLESSGLLSAAPVMNIGESQEISDLFDRMIQESQGKPPAYELLLPALLQQIIALMGRQLVIHQNESTYRTRQKLMNAVEAMHQHYGEPRTIEQYATDCGMSKYHFSHMFNETFGMAPREYLSHIRLERAKELLSSSDLPIGKIGIICGYDNPLYFSRFFSSHCGTSPSQYRKDTSLLPSE